MDKQLNPCPFCGSEVRISKSLIAGIPMFFCDKCGATVSFHPIEEEKKAVEAWNKRMEVNNG